MKIPSILAAVAISMTLAGCMTSKIVERQPLTLSKTQVVQVKSAVSYKLIDPDSANFRNIRAQKAKLEDGSIYLTVCGDVNSRNRMGGYAGFTPFKGHIENGLFKLDYIDGLKDHYASWACTDVR